MPDTEHVVVRCPNGHDLQAAREHLSRPLACPICNTTFTPTGGPAATPTTPPTSPQPLNYANRSVLAPVERPAFTHWLIVAWFVTQVVELINSLATRFGGVTVDPTQTTSPATGALILLGAAGAVGLWVGLVLHPMWMHRVHSDAVRARGYRTISPGMALGLSFVPLFNFIWAGWTMQKLVAYSEAGTEPSSSRSPASAAARGCLVAGAVLCVSHIAWNILLLNAVMSQMPELFAAGSDPGSMVSFVNDLIQGPLRNSVLTLSVIKVVGVLAYARAIRRTESVLYSFLKATP